ncbi:MAG: hypothetical protein ACYDBV_11050 [Nitrospiria bacterium]
MAKSDVVIKKVARLKKKLNSLAQSVEGKEGSRETTRLWHKRLKRAQRKRKSAELNVLHMQNKKAKKKTGEETKEAPKTEEGSAA